MLVVSVCVIAARDVHLDVSHIHFFSDGAGPNGLSFPNQVMSL